MDETDEYCRPASLEDLKVLIASLNANQANRARQRCSR